MEDHKKIFEEFCAETFFEGENKGSKSMTRAKGEKVIALLSEGGNPDEYSPKFKHSLYKKNVQCTPNMVCYICPIWNTLYGVK